VVSIFCTWTGLGVRIEPFRSSDGGGDVCYLSSCDSSESSWLTCEAMKCQTTLSVACACLHHRLIFYRSSSDSHRPRPHPVAPVSNASPRVPGAGPLCIRSLFICVETSPELISWTLEEVYGRPENVCESARLLVRFITRKQRDKCRCQSDRKDRTAHTKD
jgi:hypothetical protein